MINDQVLLETYMRGFNDELDGRKRLIGTDSMLNRAYNLGRDDAIIGDEVSLSDKQSNEEILAMIKNSQKDLPSPTEEEVIDTILGKVFIRGIDLEDYRREFTEERSGLISALRKLFKNKHKNESELKAH